MPFVFLPPDAGRLGDVLILLAIARDYARRSRPVKVQLPMDRALFHRHLTIPDVDVVADHDASADFVFVANDGELIRVDWPAGTRFLVGVSPMLADVARAQATIAQLLARGVPRRSVRRVLWNDGAPGGLARTAIEQETGPMDAVLPYDPHLLYACENQRSLPASNAGRSRMPRAIADFAGMLERWIDGPEESSERGEMENEWGNVERTICATLWTGLSNTDAASSSELKFRINQLVQRFVAEQKIREASPLQLATLEQRVFDQLSGLGPLEPLLRDRSINEIMVNGAREVFLERDGVIEKTAIAFESETQLRTVIDRAVARVGRRVDWASPLCDVRLEDGSRLNVVLPPLSLNGATLTLRRFKPLYSSLEDLAAAGTIDGAQQARLAEAVRSRRNIVVAGNSGAGKTTLLNVLAGLIDPQERILTLEDAAELAIRQPHVVRLETRAKNAEGTGAITMEDLVKNALRMRPDRLIVGECRGGEVIPMLQAMNTGHDGSMTTVHANSADDALRRLESLVLLHAPEWPIAVVREQIQAGIDTVVFIKRTGSERKVLEIRDV